VAFGVAAFGQLEASSSRTEAVPEGGERRCGERLHARGEVEREQVALPNEVSAQASDCL
jgi:hypothetical protein